MSDQDNNLPDIDVSKHAGEREPTADERNELLRIMNTANFESKLELGSIIEGLIMQRNDWQADALRLREALYCTNESHKLINWVRLVSTCASQGRELCSACRAIAAHDKLVGEPNE